MENKNNKKNNSVYASNSKELLKDKDITLNISSNYGIKKTLKCNRNIKLKELILKLKI